MKVYNKFGKGLSHKNVILIQDIDPFWICAQDKNCQTSLVRADMTMMLACFLMKPWCARVSLSKIDREKNSLDRERIFFPVKFIFPCQMTFFPVNIFFPCQVLTFFPCQFLINSSKVTTIKSSPFRLRDKSNTSIMCKKIQRLNFFRSKRLKLNGHESNWTVQKTKSGRSEGMKLDGLNKCKWTVKRAKTGRSKEQTQDGLMG